MRALSCLVLLAAACAGAPAGSAPARPAAASPACADRPTDPALARLVASSTLILAGVPDASRERLGAAAARNVYFEFAVGGLEALKGVAARDPLTVRDFPGGQDGGPSDESILGASGARSILFLVEGGGRPDPLFFAGWDKMALRPATRANLAAARDEIARQSRIAAAWAPAPDVPHFDRVRDLVEALVAVGRLEAGHDAKIEAQQRIFEQLEELGSLAVPAIVAHMDDRRPLPVGQISLRNRSPNAWEGIVHYGPDLVVDVLDAILSQLTGRSFLTIVNGGSEEQRRAAVSAWRVHVHDLACNGSR